MDGNHTTKTEVNIRFGLTSNWCKQALPVIRTMKVKEMLAKVTAEVTVAINNSLCGLQKTEAKSGATKVNVIAQGALAGHSQPLSNTCHAANTPIVTCGRSHSSFIPLSFRYTSQWLRKNKLH